MFALRLAAATQRVLLLDWTHPVALTEFLVPSLIDWRITPDVSAALRGNQLRVHWSSPSQPVPAEVRTSGPSSIHALLRTQQARQLAGCAHTVPRAMRRNTLPARSSPPGRCSTRLPGT